MSVWLNAHRHTQTHTHNIHADMLMNRLQRETNISSKIIRDFHITRLGEGLPRNEGLGNTVPKNYEHFDQRGERDQTVWLNRGCTASQWLWKLIPGMQKIFHRHPLRLRPEIILL